MSYQVHPDEHVAGRGGVSAIETVVAAHSNDPPLKVLQGCPCAHLRGGHSNMHRVGQLSPRCDTHAAHVNAPGGFCAYLLDQVAAEETLRGAGVQQAVDVLLAVLWCC